MSANTPTTDTTTQQVPINVNINDNKGNYTNIVNAIKTFLVKNIDKVLQSIAKNEIEEEVVDIMKRLDTLHIVQLCTPSSVAAGLLNLNFGVNGDIPQDSNLKIVDMFVEKGYLIIIIEFSTTETKVELYTKYCGDPVDVKKQQLDMYNTIRLKYADMLISQLSNIFSNLVEDLKKKFDDMENEYEKRLSEERQKLQEKIEKLKSENKKLKERLSYLIDAAKKIEEEQEEIEEDP